MRRSRRFVPIFSADCRKKKNVPVKHVLKKNPQISPITQKNLARRRKVAKTQSFLQFIFPADETDFHKYSDSSLR